MDKHASKIIEIIALVKNICTLLLVIMSHDFNQVFDTLTH